MKKVYRIIKHIGYFWIERLVPAHTETKFLFFTKTTPERWERISYEFDTLEEAKREVALYEKEDKEKVKELMFARSEPTKQLQEH